MVIVLELYIWEQLIPVILPFAAEDPEILLQLLVDVLCLPIRLGVICSGGLKLDPKQAVQFPSEFCNKVGTSI